MAHNWQLRLGHQAILPVCVASTLVVAAMTGFVLLAQAATSGRPTFEVAAIRLSKDCGGGARGGTKRGGSGLRGVSPSPAG